jgi:predicted dehydrogenase
LEFQQRHGIPKGCGDPAEIFTDSEIDAVYLATPVFLHCLHTIEAAEHGKHVLCEKPMARDAAECQRMVDACRSHGVKLGIAYYRRFYPVVQKIEELLRTEALGKVILVRSTLVSPTSLEPAAWRFVPDQGGGGLLMDMVSHRLDLLCMLFGQPLSVSALTATRDLGIPVEDTGSLLIEFADGVHAAVFASHCIHAEMDDFEIFGTLGSLRVSPLNESELIVSGATNATFHLPKADNVHLPLIEDFNQAIRGNHEPRISGLEGMKTSVLLEASYQAAHEGKVIRFAKMANER